MRAPQPPRVFRKEKNWAELAFAKTSGILTGDAPVSYWPIQFNSIQFNSYFYEIFTLVGIH